MTFSDSVCVCVCKFLDNILLIYCCILAKLSQSIFDASKHAVVNIQCVLWVRFWSCTDFWHCFAVLKSINIFLWYIFFFINVLYLLLRSNHTPGAVTVLKNRPDMHSFQITHLFLITYFGYTLENFRFQKVQWRYSLSCFRMLNERMFHWPLQL